MNMWRLKSGHQMTGGGNNADAALLEWWAVGAVEQTSVSPPSGVGQSRNVWCGERLWTSQSLSLPQHHGPHPNPASSGATAKGKGQTTKEERTVTLEAMAEI